MPMGKLYFVDSLFKESFNRNEIDSEIFSFSSREKTKTYKMGYYDPKQFLLFDMASTFKMIG